MKNHILKNFIFLTLAVVYSITVCMPFSALAETSLEYFLRTEGAEIGLTDITEDNITEYVFDRKIICTDICGV